MPLVLLVHTSPVFLVLYPPATLPAYTVRGIWSMLPVKILILEKSPCATDASRPVIAFSVT